ncbi:hypothetical protein P8625_11815 [Tenacibaculum tangerinum]|uniref:SMI1/KNR4 family protein n=1 Tax=Tenacibaculum tangerinum TaxID=3038772 RepID=A0ABY8L0E8_9FLAO|nr:hypothetical protein [Tenacibaculum tangerinum]WGH74764.1 hypothetical protein P8625_11815 [Tenacibaculum tangerinum]
MEKLKFIKTKTGSNWVQPKNINYLLLSEFLGDYGRHFPSQQDETIENLELVLSGEKTFDDIQDPEVYWSFGGGLGLGYFEVEGTTAYFEPDKELTDAPRIVMPLEEFINILKEWRAFLRS